MAGLGGDDHVVVAALQRLGDQPLVVADLVGVACSRRLRCRSGSRPRRARHGWCGSTAPPAVGPRAIGIAPSPIGKTSVPASRRVLVSIVVMSTTFPTPRKAKRWGAQCKRVAAAPSPERTTPSMYPLQCSAYSAPAQCSSPTAPAARDRTLIPRRARPRAGATGGSGSSRAGRMRSSTHARR